MKKLLSLAAIGAAIGATAYYIQNKNDRHVEQTLEALDDISRSAEEAVANLAEEITEEEA